MQDWLLEVLAASAGDLPEEIEGYLLGRGMRSSLIQRLGVGCWTPAAHPAPDKAFQDRYGVRGERLQGQVLVPMLSPRGALLGVETRTWRWADGKHISDYRVPESRWNPVFLGMSPDAMTRIWQGANVWICEGLFDLAALDRIVPSTDVVLATLRAKISAQHAAFLQRFLQHGRQVYMVYDRDATGRKQTVGWEDPVTGKHRWGALELLERVSVSCLDVYYEGGKDPGEIWDRGGERALREAFSHVLP